MEKTASKLVSIVEGLPFEPSTPVAGNAPGQAVGGLDSLPSVLSPCGIVAQRNASMDLSFIHPSLTAGVDKLALDYDPFWLGAVVEGPDGLTLYGNTEELGQWIQDGELPGMTADSVATTVQGWIQAIEDDRDEQGDDGHRGDDPDDPNYDHNYHDPEME